MTEQTTDMVKVKEQATDLAIGSVFGDITAFTNAQRMVKPLAESSLVPEAFRGKIGECMIALEMAQRIGASPLAVMQNLYVVHGKPAWSSQFLIAAINACGKFSPLRYRIIGEAGTDSYGKVAWAYDKRGDKLEAPAVTLAMAKAEGWYSKNGSKWKTMPDLMLSYRAATFFARTYCPELTMGIKTQEEVIDISAETVETNTNESPMLKALESAKVEHVQPADKKDGELI